MNKIFSFLVILSAGFCFSSPQGDPGRIGIEISKAIKGNSELLKSYSWKMRLGVEKNGKTEPAKLYMVRFDIDGKLQVTPLNADSEDGRKIRPLKRLKERRKEKKDDFVEKVQELADQYANPTTGQLVDFCQQGRFKAGVGGMKGTLKVHGEKLIQPGDTATLWVRSDGYLPQKIAFTSQLKKNSLTGTIVFRTLENGPVYPARTIVQIASRKNTRITIENFDYNRQE